MNAWKGLVSSTLDDLKPRGNESHSARFAADSYDVELNDVGWPMQINGITWQEFFMTWQENRDKFSSDWHRIQLLRSVLSPQDEKQFGSATNPDSLVYSLMVKYGNETNFVLCKLRELKSLAKPDPSDTKMITSNLNIMKRNLLYILDLNHEKRLDSITVKNIVNAALDRYTLKEYNIQYNQFRNKQMMKAQVSCPGINPENFNLYFDSASLLTERLDFLIGFID